MAQRQPEVPNLLPLRDKLREQADHVARLVTAGDCQSDLALYSATFAFVESIALYYLPLDQRLPNGPVDSATRLSLNTARLRERYFITQMRQLAAAVADGCPKPFDESQAKMEGLLAATATRAGHETFADLVPRWRARLEERRQQKQNPPRPPEQPAGPSASGVQGRLPTNRPHPAASARATGAGPSSARQKARKQASRHSKARERVASAPRDDDAGASAAASAAHTPLSARTADQASQGETRARNDPFPTQERPDEANGYGVATSDGVLVGHPPDFPAALVDWNDEDSDEKEEIVFRALHQSSFGAMTDALCEAGRSLARSSIDTMTDALSQAGRRLFPAEDEASPEAHNDLDSDWELLGD